MLLTFTGLGFGLPAVWGMKSLAKGVPLMFAFPAYGGGGFERAGLASSVALVATFLAVCIGELAAAGLVWDGRRMACPAAACARGGVWGSDLPFPPVFAAARTLLLWYGWSGLS